MLSPCCRRVVVVLSSCCRHVVDGRVGACVGAGLGGGGTGYAPPKVCVLGGAKPRPARGVGVGGVARPSPLRIFFENDICRDICRFSKNDICRDICRFQKKFAVVRVGLRPQPQPHGRGGASPRPTHTLWAGRSPSHPRPTPHPHTPPPCRRRHDDNTTTTRRQHDDNMATTWRSPLRRILRWRTVRR